VIWNRVTQDVALTGVSQRGGEGAAQLFARVDLEHVSTRRRRNVFESASRSASNNALPCPGEIHRGLSVCAGAGGETSLTWDPNSDSPTRSVVRVCPASASASVSLPAS